MVRTKRAFAQVLAAVLASACRSPRTSSPPSGVNSTSTQSSASPQVTARAAPTAVFAASAASGAGDAASPLPARAAFVPIDSLRDALMLRPSDLDSVTGSPSPFSFVARDWPTVSPTALPAGVSFVAEVREGKIVRSNGVAPAADELARTLLERERTRHPDEPRYFEHVWVKEGRAFAGNTGDLRRALVPIDSAEKALVLLDYGHGRKLEWTALPAKKCVGCAGRFVRRSPEGHFELVGEDTGWMRGPCPHSNNTPFQALFLFEVRRDGSVGRRGEAPGPWPPPSSSRRSTPCIGRDSAGSGREYRVPDSLGAYVAQLAHDEAISIGSFRRLARELEASHAPTRFVGRARSAARDEAQHAKRMAALASELGGSLRRVPVRDLSLRSRRAWLIENVVEGCVRETYSAVVAAYQAKYAPLARARRAFSRIAREEAEHARLAWDIHAWALADAPSAAFVPDLASAMRDAFEDLEREISERATPAFLQGWEPPPTVALGIARGLRTLHVK